MPNVPPMADHKLRFRWWYLVLVLPIVLFVGARWYVGHRIDRAIASANEDENTLTVAGYSFGFFPVHLTATGISFDQQRETFAAAGRLQRLQFSGLSLISLFNRGPIEVDQLRLSGIDASLTRHAVIPKDSSQSDPLRLIVEEVTLDSTYMVIEDEVNQQALHLTQLQPRPPVPAPAVPTRQRNAPTHRG